MTSTKIENNNVNAPCENLQKTAVNNEQTSTQKSVTFEKRLKKRKESKKKSLNWGTHKSAPAIRLEKLYEFKKASTTGLKKLILNKRVDKSLTPCYDTFPTLSYCLHCGNPGHTFEQCNPHRRDLKLKYFKKKKDDSGSHKSFIDFKQWSREVNTFFLCHLIKPNVGINQNYSPKNSSISTKQPDASPFNKNSLKKKINLPKEQPSSQLLAHDENYSNKQCDMLHHPTPLPLIPHDPKKHSKVFNKENETKDAKLMMTLMMMRMGSNNKNCTRSMESQPSPRFMRFNKCCQSKIMLLKNKVVNIMVSKTSPQQGAHMEAKALSSLSLYPIHLDEIPMTLVLGIVNGVKTYVLIDTGCSIATIAESFAKKLRLKTWLTGNTLVVTLANNCIERYPEKNCLVTLKIGDFETCEEFNVFPNQICNVTVSKRWLKRHKVICDYGKDLLHLPTSLSIPIGFHKTTKPLSIIV